MTDTKNNQKTDSFDFLDGYNSASKSRILLYLAGDVFTASLAELVFWPLEENIFDGQKCRGTVSYDNNDKVIGYDIMDNNAKTLWYSPTRQ